MSMKNPRARSTPPKTHHFKDRGASQNESVMLVLARGASRRTSRSKSGTHRRNPLKTKIAANPMVAICSCGALFRVLLAWLIRRILTMTQAVKAATGVAAKKTGWLS